MKRSGIELRSSTEGGISAAHIRDPDAPHRPTGSTSGKPFAQDDRESAELDNAVGEGSPLPSSAGCRVGEHRRGGACSSRFA